MKSRNPHAIDGIPQPQEEPHLLGLTHRLRPISADIRTSRQSRLIYLEQLPQWVKHGPDIALDGALAGHLQAHAIALDLHYSSALSF